MDLGLITLISCQIAIGGMLLCVCKYVCVHARALIGRMVKRWLVWAVRHLRHISLSPYLLDMLEYSNVS